MVFLVDKHAGNTPQQAHYLSQVASSVRHYTSGFITSYTNVAIVTFGRNMTTNETQRLIPMHQSGRIKLAKKLDRLNNSESNVLDLHSALEQAVNLLNSASASQRSVLLFSTRNFSNKTLFKNLLKDELSRPIPVHVFTSLPSAKPLRTCAIKKRFGSYHIKDQVSHFCWSVYEQAMHVGKGTGHDRKE